MEGALSKRATLYQRPSALTGGSPIARADRGDGVGLGDQPAPGVAGGIDDVLVGVEDAGGEPVLAQVRPDVLDRVHLRGAPRQPDQGDGVRNREGCGRVPAGPVEQQDGMSASSDGPGNLVKV